MKVAVTRAVFDTEFGLEVRASRDEFTRASRPKATDFPPDLVAAIRDWAEAGLHGGVHEDYRVPAQLVAYLNEWAHGTHPATDSGRIVARYVLDLLGLDTEGGN